MFSSRNGRQTGATTNILRGLPEHHDRSLGFEGRETSVVVNLHQVGLLTEDRPRDGVSLRARDVVVENKVYVGVELSEIGHRLK